MVQDIISPLIEWPWGILPNRATRLGNVWMGRALDTSHSGSRIEHSLVAPRNMSLFSWSCEPPIDPRVKGLGSKYHSMISFQPSLLTRVRISPASNLGVSIVSWITVLLSLCPFVLANCAKKSPIALSSLDTCNTSNVRKPWVMHKLCSRYLDRTKSFVW